MILLLCYYRFNRTWLPQI